jgi:hypothetical protein
MKKGRLVEEWSRLIEGAYLAVDTCRIAKKPGPPKPISWTISEIAAKAVRLGAVGAPDEATAMEKAAADAIRDDPPQRRNHPLRSQAQMAASRPKCGKSALDSNI